MSPSERSSRYELYQKFCQPLGKMGLLPSAYRSP